MPSNFWVEALHYAIHLINILPTTTLNHLSPYEALYGKSPLYTTIRVFGCLCYPNHVKHTTSKFIPRSSPCIFLGFSRHHKGFRCLNPETQRVTISRHVRFSEEVFPYVHFYRHLAPAAPSLFPTNYNFQDLFPTTPFLYQHFTKIHIIQSAAFADKTSNMSEVKKNYDPKSNGSNGDVIFEVNGNVCNGKVFKIFIGYDPREDLAYEVCRYSLLKRSSIPIEIHPIKQSELREKGLYWRERGKFESTEFSFSRFLTPYLAGYDGWAMFVDCDFLYLGDIRELVELVDDKYALMCVQHDYTPKETTKMDGVVQTLYPRKNWSSMVLYNCLHPKNKVLTPDVVNSQTGAFLHRFQWLEDGEIGEVPFVWNFLVGHNKVVEGDPKTVPRAIHYTLGGPWFEAWKDCEFGELWLNEMEEYKKAAEVRVD